MSVFLRHILEFYKYNSDVRKKYLDAIEKLPWQEVIKDRRASYPSIRDVFLHVLDAYRYWFQYVREDKLKQYKPATTNSYNSVDDIRKYEREVDNMVMKLVESTREQDLSRVFVVHVEGSARKGTMEDILMHMIEVELQHRGEINCMLWQQGSDPPITGYREWHENKAS